MLYLLRQTPVKTLKHLPKFLPKDNDFKNTALICDDEHEKLRLAILDVKDQFFVETATWGLTDWERVLDISVKKGSSINDRRTQILLKLQGANVVSKAFIVKLINNFLNDASGTIVEHNKEYYFDVCFNNGSLFDWEGLQEAIEIYKPAHLGVKYFALQNTQSNVSIYGIINIAEQIEIEAEAGYSIDPVEASFFVAGAINIAEQTELNFDTSIGERNLSLDGKTIFYGITNDANTIEI